VIPAFAAWLRTASRTTLSKPSSRARGGAALALLLHVGVAFLAQRVDLRLDLLALRDLLLDELLARGGRHRRERRRAARRGTSVSFLSPDAIASIRSARPALSLPPSFERKPSRDATADGSRSRRGRAWPRARPARRRAIGHERAREIAVQLRELVVHRRREREHAAVLRIAANVPPPVVAICCQTGVVSARSPHCTALITMPFWRARATLRPNFTSSG
jgi:hypothetical protein